MQKEIIALRKKLPKRGYVKIILQAERSIVGKRKRLRFTEDEIKNLFTGRAVKDESKQLILEATGKALVNRSKFEKRIKRMAAAA